MTTKKTFEERAGEIVIKWESQHEGNAIWIVRLCELAYLIAQALQEAYEQGRDETRKEIKET